MGKILFDQHLHSSFSYDSMPDVTIQRIIEAAVEKGLAGIAITDHFDPLWPDEDDLSSLDLPSYEKALLESESMSAGLLRFVKAVELGFLPGEGLNMCREAVSRFPYDFVIGSVHHSETTPIDFPAFLEGHTLETIIDNYYTLLYESVKAYKDYDVLGHINNIDRYTDGFAPEGLYMPYIDEILKIAISDGKGLEINTSSFKYGIGEHGTPTQPILKRYYELGGEIITIGSDAHRIPNIGAHIEDSMDMLVEVGFRYFAVFKERRPEFFNLV